jgi:hypothetical protein
MKKIFGLLMVAVVAFAMGCGDTKKKTTTTEKKDGDTKTTTTEEKTDK